MSAEAGTGQSGVAEAETAASSWCIRAASVDDVAAVAAAVEELLVELGGKRPSPADLEDATRTLVLDPSAGALLVAEAEGAIVGFLAASWQHAIHVPGRYGVIQDLWVSAAWRSKTIGHDLVEAFAKISREQGVGRIEVGLPQESFAAIRATEAFYRRNGFAPLGPRMRRLLS
jgi:GNAT superfamily N-acetyltransferase